MATESDETCSPALRMKRRQSDARWRANVATCFETLKHVIPMNRRATKRQISKAYVLHEASQHIHFLEDILQKLLKEKGHVKGESNPEMYCEEQFEDIKQAFIDKQPHRGTPHRVKDKDEPCPSQNSACREDLSSESNELKDTARRRKEISQSGGRWIRKAGKGKTRRKPIITSVIDDVVHDGSVKTTTVRSIDPYDEGYEVVGYGCAPKIMKKVLSKPLSKPSKAGKRCSVSSVEPMVDKVIVKRTVTKGGKDETKAGLVIDMQYSRLRVNKSNVRKKGQPKSTVPKKMMSVSPKTPKLIASPHFSDCGSTKSNNSSTVAHFGAWTPERNSRQENPGNPYFSPISANSSKDNSHSWPSPIVESETQPIYSPLNMSETSEMYRARNYTTPVKQQNDGATGFTPVRLPNFASCVFQDWEEGDDDLDSAASLICDEDLPVSDGEEDFIETNRSRHGRLKRDIFNRALLPKRKRCDTDRTVCSGLERGAARPKVFRRTVKDSGVRRNSPANGIILKCRRSLDWHNVISKDEADYVVDDAMSLLLPDSISPETIASVNDSSLSDDLRDLDIIPIDLKTDPVEKIDEYITGQEKTSSNSDCSHVFDQIFSGDYFNERFDSHINQLDSLQRELRKLEEDPSGSIPVGKISSGCDVDNFY